MTVCLSFLRRHFGSDLLMANWFMLWSSIIFTILGILGIFLGGKNSPNAVVRGATQSISGILFVVGSAVLLHMSYDPNSLIKMMIEMANLDIESLSFWQKYFTSSNLLLVAWLFFVATVIVFVYPVYVWASGDLPPVWFVVYLITVVLMTLSTLLWVVALFPVNTLKNGGRGSSYVQDFCFGGKCIKRTLDQCMYVCIGADSFVDTYFGVDFIAMSWSLLFLAVVSLIASLFLIVAEPYSFVTYLRLLSSMFFVAGAFMFSHSLYPENSTSNICWQYACVYLCRCGRCGDRWYRNEQDDDDNHDNDDILMGPRVINDCSGDNDASIVRDGDKEVANMLTSVYENEYNQRRTSATESSVLLDNLTISAQK